VTTDVFDDTLPFELPRLLELLELLELLGLLRELVACLLRELVLLPRELELLPRELVLLPRELAALLCEAPPRALEPFELPDVLRLVEERALAWAIAPP